MSMNAHPAARRPLYHDRAGAGRRFRLPVLAALMALALPALLGGTGKFAGISGGYDYELAFVASPREGLIQWVGHKKGTWRIVTD
jgi:hypothetical protein